MSSGAQAAVASAYAELAVSTCFSFLRGASTPEELVDQAIDLGHTGMAVTDLNSLAGVVRPLSQQRRRIKDAKASGDDAKLQRLSAFHYAVGVRLSFCDGAPDVLAYPQDREAYGRLSRLLTLGNTRPGVKKAQCRLAFEDLVASADGLLLALVPPAWPEPQGAVRSYLDRLVDIAPDRVWLAAAQAYGPADGRRLHTLAQIAEVCGARLLAVNDVLYHCAARRELQDVMTCIREHVMLAAAGRKLEPNGERRLKSGEEMARLFAPYPDAIVQTQRLLQRCRVAPMRRRILPIGY